MLCSRTSTMQTLSALLLFVSVTSAFAFPSHGRHRRGTANAGAGAGATAGSFATSGAYGNGYGYGPSAFDSAFRSYFDQMESLLAAQQAHAQALSNRYWSDWRHPAAAGYPAGGAFGAGPAFVPNYYHYYSGVPTASHSHSAVSFFPHRFNAAAANAIPSNTVDAGHGQLVYPGQSGSASHYAGAFSGGPGGGTGFGYGHGGAGGAGVGAGVGAGAGGADAGGHAPSSFSDFGAGGAGGAGGGSGSHVGSGLGGAAHGAQASLAVNNRGGFGQAQLFPDPGLNSRIAGDIAPLSGSGNFGVFSSSSSSSHSDGSGKTHTFKQATVGVNDNGKVTTFSVKDP
ncbi:uncharacterized protein GBIM_03664 [Gryllus bimaculatus]|nr:uncharacterized protein GBIM_03664 [Gryllus bimaculatus]